MNLVGNNLGDFIFSNWLWGATMSWAQLFFALIIFIMLVHYFLGKRWITAIIQGLIIQLISFWLFTLIAVGLIMYLCAWKYVHGCASDQFKQVAVFQSCISLASIYAIINTVILLLLKCIIRIKIRWYVLYAWLSQLLGALFGYMWIMLFLWYLI